MPAHAIDELDEILTARPGAMLRHGSTIIGLVTAAMLLMAYFVRYPDVVTGRITLTTREPPAPVLSRADGLVERLWVHDGECVEQGQVLARLATPGDGDELLVLGDHLVELEALVDDPERLEAALRPPRRSLGPLHTSYVALQAATEAHGQLVEEERDGQGKALQARQRTSVEALLRQTEAQIGLLTQDVEVARKRHEQDEGLRERGVLTGQESESSRSTVLRRRLDLGAARLTELELRLQLAQTDGAFLDVELQRQDERRERLAAVKAAFRRLQLDYLTWEDAHVMRAPIDGCVSMRRVWSDHQAVRTGDEVMLIVPQGSTITGRIQLPQASAGKVEPGQALTIRLDSYPMYEYGLLHGRVQSVAAVGDEQGFPTTAELTGGMVTDQHVTLELRQGMEGEASIVTRERRLLERVFSQISIALFGERAPRG
jgi:multidrug resistance efflux pump